MLLPMHGLCYVYSLSCLSDYGICFSNNCVIGCNCKNKILGLICFNIIYAICLYKLFNWLCFSLFHFEEHIQWLPVGQLPRLKASSRYVCNQFIWNFNIKDCDIVNTCFMYWNKMTVSFLWIMPLQFDKIIH